MSFDEYEGPPKPPTEEEPQEFPTIPQIKAWWEHLNPPPE